MKQGTLIIQNPTGLHARPARLFVDTAKKFRSTIQVQCADRKANGKSMISLLTLGIERGTEITVLADGIDEADAYAALAQLIGDGFGELHVGEPSVAQLQNGHASSQPFAGNGATPHDLSVSVAPSSPQPNHLLNGLIAAPGIAIGQIFHIKKMAVQLPEFGGDVAHEQQILHNAIAQAKTQLEALRAKLATSDPTKADTSSEANIFAAHKEIIEDADLLQAVNAKIGEKQSAAKAWQQLIAQHAAQMRQLPDPTLAARAADIQDVGARVLNILLNVSDVAPQWPDHPVIVVAQELLPSDMAALDVEKVRGICVAEGGPTAHASILARSLGIPALVSADAKLHQLPNGTQIIINALGQARLGQIDLTPTAAALVEAEAAQQSWQRQRQQAAQLAHTAAVTLDKHRVEVVANIGSVADAALAMASGAEGVGLLRTEFLFIDSPVSPSEQTQFETYRAILQAMNELPVIIRTLDIGGDKPVAYLDMPAEKNPFLGERGIRLCLNRPDILRTQLRAILRAAGAGRVRIMIPMIADFDEWRAVRDLVTQIKAEFVAQVELGIMIEVPSAAVMADVFAAEVDFFSVGTNDLTQYTLAMDRQHPALAHKADALHPAVLRLIAQTVAAAHKAGKWVGVCGEIGADLQAVPILVGLGVDELSVNPKAIAMVKAQIRQLTFAQAQTLAQRALACATAGAVRSLTHR
ncbi:MAG: phosphoenolpyruvate--protein phosphotransferase [Anaerolineae bacterium]|nr:phosphoenolpyruvate--protein phosphotransferase [Anaerolineae bacterium]